jgi:hypothetical protein
MIRRAVVIFGAAILCGTILKPMIRVDERRPFKQKFA